MKRVGILGTETVMSSGMYGKLSPVDVLPPAGSDLQRVHDAYVTLAQSGILLRNCESFSKMRVKRW